MAKHYKRKSNQESLGQAIDRLLNVYRLKSGLTQLSIQSDWEKIVGPALASRTEEVQLRGSKLIIKVNSAAMRQEMHYQQSAIMKNVNDHLGSEVVKEIFLN